MSEHRSGHDRERDRGHGESSTSSSSRHHSSHRRSSRSRSPDLNRDRDRDRHSSSRSHRDREDKDKDRDRKRSRRDREESDEEGGGGGGEDPGLPEGVEELSAEDYFSKSNELKLWLNEEKGKVRLFFCSFALVVEVDADWSFCRLGEQKLDELSGDHARKYFKKFYRAWNKGRLAPKFYTGISSSSLPSNISSSFSWSFSKASQRELDDAASIRKSIDHGPSSGRSPPRSQQLQHQQQSQSHQRGKVMGPTMGPTMPGGSGSALQDLQLAREAEASQRDYERSQSSAAYRKERKEGRDEERDNRATGRDRLIEKRREGNAVNKSWAEGKEAGAAPEIDDDTLMGGGSSFQAAIAARDRQGQRPNKWQQAQEEKKAAMSDKVQQFRSKEADTMAMFQKMAAERYG